MCYLYIKRPQLASMLNLFDIEIKLMYVCTVCMCVCMYMSDKDRKVNRNI